MANPGQPPDLGDRYKLEHLIGRGAAGVVYAGTDSALNRRVAIKILHADDDTSRERFVQEARLVAGLSHPNIVNIWDVGVSNENLYIVMEFLDGSSLKQVLAGRKGPLDLFTAVRMLIDVGQALEFAHRNDVVHRDIKPANVMLLRDGRAKILDFGIAKMVSRMSASVTQVGTFVGTPSYMSPEQIQGDVVDQRSDLFSFGAVAFESLTGTQAFAGDSLPQILQRVLHQRPARISALAPGCPARLDALVDRCLEKDPSQRPGSATDVLLDLRAILQELDAPPPISQPSPSAEPGPRRSELPAGPSDLPIVEGGTVAGPVIGNHTLTMGRDRPADSGSAPAGLPPPRNEGGPLKWPKPVPSPVPGARPLPPGTAVDRFIVHESVGRGQTGHFYKAFDPVRSRLVGLKVIDDRSGVAVGRLLRSSRIWLDLRHDNLQTILEVNLGSVQAPAFIVTELIEGLNLERIAAQQKLELVQKIDIILQVCDALDYMHRKGIVHREVIPRNIIVSQPGYSVKVLDSGLARSNDVAETSFTRAGVAVGDLTYMAPEQAGSRYDQRSDVYSIGAVLFQLVLDEAPKPLAPEDMQRRLDAIDSLPSRLVTAIRSAIEPNPDDRFASVRELSDHLRPLVPVRLAPLNLSDVVVTLHGIRTHARWQRAFSEVGGRSGLHCKLDRWNFGYFSVFRFLSPWSRQARVSWFRSTYHDEFADHPMSELSTDRPSVVAHSFGTYILGNALLRYPYLRFNRVLLCGSILPPSFPWDAIIDRGQVQAVRNEYGARDAWTSLARWFIAGTGPSGLTGFTCSHKRFEQERFDFSHSEYFERGHMEARWVPFLKQRLTHITPRERVVTPSAAGTPWGVFALYGLVVGAVIAGAYWWLASA